MSTNTESNHNPGKTITIKGIEITFTKTFLVGSVVAVVVTSLIITIIVLATRKTPTQRVTTCNSVACYSYAARLIESLDTTVNPCDNFYQYSCGKWIQNALVDDTQQWEAGFQQQEVVMNKRLRSILESQSTSLSYIINAQNAYSTCMEQNKTKEINTLYEEITKITKGFPLVERNKWTTENPIDSINSLLQFLIPLRQRNWSPGALFTLTVMNDLFNNNNSILYISQPSSSAFKKFQNYETIFNVCKDFSKKCNQANQEIVKVIKYVNQTQQILDPTRLLVSDGYMKMKISDFTTLTPNIDWLKYFNNLFTNIHTFKSTDEIAINNLPYFAALNLIVLPGQSLDFISVINLEILYLMDAVQTEQTVISKLQYHSSSNVFSLYNAPTPRDTPSWLQCVQTVSSWFRIGLAVEYATQYYDIDKQVKSVKELAQSLIDIFHQSLDALEWLDKPSKKIARLKLDNMKENILFPNWARDPKNLLKFYENLDIGPSHVKNYLNALQFLAKKNLNRLNPTKDNLVDWEANSLAPNAFYSQNSNAFFITTAILQLPLFDADMLYAMKYGTMGSALGHEITHGFDLTGTKFNQFGNLEDWLTPQVNQVFRDKSQCFIDQYSKLFITTEEMPTLVQNYYVNGSNTLSENIADNGGLQQAFWAYQKWTRLNGQEKMPDLLREFTPEQLFFLSFSHYWCIKYSYSHLLPYILYYDEHSPPKSRVLGVLANFEEFNKAFNCPSINKTKICKIW